MKRPEKNEFAPYYGRYIELVPEEPIVAFLKNQQLSTTSFLQNIPEEKWTYAYAPGKWSLAESWIHVLDTERIFAYRALRISRGDTTPLPGFEQDDYVPQSGAKNRSGQSIMEEFNTVRSATISLLKHCTEEMWTAMGHASNNPVSTRALAYMMAGHVEHHIIITKERYLP